ncbi:hypothetical protein PT015_02610 [Candidatus Mycobacterium wuenschmannii]|uniref:Uncharacterized protein n=1 Tax=Candidatus Mycobacterium wuenschmannii TaxID=3027808 RepID=A0ABY8VXR2_9MYCO|nr:hypothetical protein [Candidatus Mycobacterium wuenschmannii]WIM88415.1 hypothetical protein PT015_02610 [Candidatus Mycobacterium wuenschmannii]
MHAVTKRAIIGTAAIAAAGLFGSLPYSGSPVAEQDAPSVQHHDVALVDAVSDAEIAYINAIAVDVVHPNGFEDSVWTAFEPHGNEFFDSTGAGGIFPVEGTIGGVPVEVGGYLNVFDGGATQLYDGYLASTTALLDEINGLFGAQAADQPLLLAALQADYIGDLPSTLAVGPNFDAVLSALGGTDDQAALADFGNYFEYFLTNLPSFSTDGYLSTTDITALFTDLDKVGMQLFTDFSALVTGLFGSL